MVDVFIRDEDVTFKDEDVTFDHELLTLTVADAYSACTVGDVVLEYAFLVSHGIQANTVAVVALVQEHNPTVADTAHVNLPQGITLNLITEGDPDPVWFDTEAAIFKDHADGVFYPHYLLAFELLDSIQENYTESPLLFIQSVLTIATVYNKQVSDSVLLSIEVSPLSVSDSINVNVPDVVELSQEYTLAASSAFDAQVAEAVLLSAEDVLTLSDGDHRNVTETVAFFVEGVNDIALFDTLHVQYADTLDVYQEYVLTVSNSDVVNAADAVLLEGYGALVVQNAYSAQTTDSVTVSEQNTLIVSDAVDAQLSDAMVLEQTYYLTTSDTYHEQAADSPILNEEDEDVVTVENIAHSQFVDALVLIQEHVANTLDCVQLQGVDTLDLLISHALAVGNCENKNFGQTVTLAFKSGFLGVVVDPYLLSLTQHRAMESVTPHRYLMQ